MSFSIQKVENVIDSEQITVTTTAAFLTALMSTYPRADFQQALLCNTGVNEIYVHFSTQPPVASSGTAGTTNATATNYIYALDPGAMMPFWMGRGAFNQCNLIAPSGNSTAVVVIGA
jgi:hypothetical protein